METTELAAKQHFSMARTRENFRAPQLVAHCRLQRIAHAVEKRLNEALCKHQNAVDRYGSFSAEADQDRIHKDRGDPSGDII